MSKKSLVTESNLAMELPKGIRPKNGSFEARATVHGVDICLHNKDLQQLIIDFEEAKEKLKGGIEYRKKKLKVEEWISEWMTTIKIPKLKASSVATSTRLLKRTFIKYMGDYRLIDVYPMDIQNAISSMLADGIAASQIRKALSNFREALDFAVASRLIPSNPCIQIEVPWEMKKEKKEVPLTVEEQNIFLQELEEEGSWYKELFYFMLLTGVRVGEVGAITWDDIDFRKKQINISKNLSCSYVEGVKREFITTPKTSAGNRSIPMMGEVEEMLISQKEKVERLKAELGSRWRAPKEFGNLVFVTTMGSTCSRYIVEKELRRIVARINEKNNSDEKFRHIHPHLLRHTFCTRCFEAGIDPKVVQVWAGHSSYSITLSIYTHVMDAKALEAARMLGNIKPEIKTGKLVLPEITARSHT